MIVFKPTPAFAASHPAHLIAFGFGAGLAPFAPGTFGTLLAWPIGWFFGAAYPAPILLGVLALLFAVGVWACSLTGRRLGAHDHSGMVWDEVVAFLLVLSVVPREFFWQLAAFVVFRAFDILKPAPIRWFERRWQGGFGVMFDDLLAAGYTLLVLALFKRFVL
ncbi:MAG TPA: phosphatidylglycerophosphatase A [Burkholderiales bacterium]|nr:phosphatidylglycerophosphatase A [Burkholderiales bacterium]